MKVGQKSNSGAKGDSWAANETKAHYIEAMKVEDANDGEPWTEMDVRDLTASVLWPAPGSEDTELGVSMEPEVDHGEAEVYTRVQA